MIAYEIRIIVWSSDLCSSDLLPVRAADGAAGAAGSVRSADALAARAAVEAAGDAGAVGDPRAGAGRGGVLHHPAGPVEDRRRRCRRRVGFLRNPALRVDAPPGPIGTASCRETGGKYA